MRRMNVSFWYNIAMALLVAAIAADLALGLDAVLNGISTMVAVALTLAVLGHGALALAWGAFAQQGARLVVSQWRAGWMAPWPLRIDGARPVLELGGTTSVPLIKSYEKSKNVDVKEIYGKDHAESFLLLADDRAAAFIMDDILLAGQIANARNPADYRILPESLRQEPYSMMLRKGDAPFKALVDRAVGAVMKSGEIEKIFAKWFNAPIPPKGVNLNFPITPAIRDAFKNPNDKGV